MSELMEKLVREVVALRERVNALEVLEAPAPISDHGALSGLGDDDHPQYLLTSQLSTSGGADKVPQLDGDGNLDIGAFKLCRQYIAPDSPPRLIPVNAEPSPVGQVTLSYQDVNAAIVLLGVWRSDTGAGLGHIIGWLARSTSRVTRYATDSRDYISGNSDDSRSKFQVRLESAGHLRVASLETAYRVRFIGLAVVW